jgi:hypothetical protein
MFMLRTILLAMLLPLTAFRTDDTKVPIVTVDHVRQLYVECGLQGLLPYEAFRKSMLGYERFKPSKHIVAICDFSKASNQKRFFVIDVAARKLLSHTFVAHGKNSGDLMATSFSNEPESLKSSLGFFRIGSIIQSPKHGIALLLDGLEKGINDNARRREIIMHGAWYVCESFVQQYGYTGKSFGCPALPDDVIKKLAPTLADGSLLYIYAGKS